VTSVPYPLRSQMAKAEKGLCICLKIMVSPVRIRVPPLLKVLQIADKIRAPAVLPKPCDKGVSTARSRKGHFWGGCRGVLQAVCGAGVDGEGDPVIGVTWICEARAA
jgi:hypothetical protein